MEFISELAAFLGGLAVAGLTHVLTARGAVGADRLVRAREAVDALLPPLRQLRALARTSEYSAVPGEQWSDAMTAFVDAWDRFGHRLPSDARHLRHSVRACVGEYVGGPAAGDLNPLLRAVPPAQHHPEWRAHAEDYLEHAVHGLQRWQDRPTGRSGQRTGRPTRIAPFDDWLTGRRWTN